MWDSLEIWFFRYTYLYWKKRSTQFTVFATCQSASLKQNDFQSCTDRMTGHSHTLIFAQECSDIWTSYITGASFYPLTVAYESDFVSATCLLADSQSVSQSNCLSCSVSFWPYFNCTVFNYHFFQSSIVWWKTEANELIIVFIGIIQFISLWTRGPFYIYSTEFIYIYSDRWRQTEIQLSII